MRAALLFAAFVALGACTSSAIAPPPVDAGNGANSALGTTCNPTLSDPCEQPSDACSIAVCDPHSHLCLRVAVDAGPACANGNPQVPSCASGACDAGAEAGDAASDAGDASDGGDAGVTDGSSDSPADGSNDATSDALTDAPADAADAGD